MIPIHVSHGVPLVWSARDASTLREEHRICGELVGCHPRLRRQTYQLSLPLRLMQEEAALLIERGLCRLVDNSSPVGLPTQSELTRFKETREEVYQEQVEECKEKRKKEILQMMDKIREGRRAKKRKLKEIEKEKSSKMSKDGTIKGDTRLAMSDKIDLNSTEVKLEGSSEQEVAVTATSCSEDRHTEMECEESSGGQDSDERRSDEKDDIKSGGKDSDEESDDSEDQRTDKKDDIQLRGKEIDIGSDDSEDEDLNPEDIPINALPRKHAMVQIHTKSVFRDIPKAPAKWTFPETAQEKLRYDVFKNLWEQGLYVTPGKKFGGDFLVYPGDPLCYHAFYIAVCLLPEEPITSLDVSTMGRLSTKVKKTTVLCSYDEGGNVTFTSLQWAAIT